MALQQGKCSVLDYVIEFCTLAAESGWYQPALVDALRVGCSSFASFKDWQTTHGATLGSRQRHWAHADWAYATLSIRTSTADQWGRMHLLCSAETLLRILPVNSTKNHIAPSMVSLTQVRSQSSWQLTQIILKSESVSLSHPVLVDSGADANLMNYELARKLGLRRIQIPSPIPATTLEGRLIYMVMEQTSPVTLKFDDGHGDDNRLFLISTYLYQSNNHPLILGFPWLLKHNPHINWATGKIEGWRKDCEITCFPHKKFSPFHSGASPPLTPDDETPDPVGVPYCYLDLKEVFSKSKALSLPPHWTYDYTIDLLPGAAIPESHLYSLSTLEHQAMEKYINSSLQAGIIRLPSSPAFFCDKTLHPCIDYTGLNDITIKNRYPSTFFCFRHFAKSEGIYKAGLKKCLPLGKNQGGEWIENRFQHTYWTLWIPGNAFWFNQCTCSFPSSWERCIKRSIKLLGFCLSWWHLNYFLWPTNTCAIS